MFMVWRIFCDSETNKSVVFTGTLDSEKMVVECHLSLLSSHFFGLVFTFDIRCPVKMNVNQLHGTASLAKLIPTCYGNCRYMTVHRRPAALINKLCKSI